MKKMLGSNLYIELANTKVNPHGASVDNSTFYDSIHLDGIFVVECIVQNNPQTAPVMLTTGEVLFDGVRIIHNLERRTQKDNQL